MGNSNVLPSNAKTVIVVGGGIAGTAVAKNLDGIAHVTLVTPLNFMQHKYGLLRANVVPGWEQAACVPLDHLLVNGKILQGTVTSVTDGSVTLEDGTVLTGDYIILAHGAGAGILPSSAPPGVVNASDFQNLLMQKQNCIRDSNSIAVIGAGPVGLELAGEIRALYPNKSITVVQSPSQILSNTSPPLIEKFITKVHARLTEMNINVLLNTKVTNLPTIPHSDGFLTDLKTLQLSNGQTLETDLTVVCIGSKAVTPLLHSSRYDEFNRIKVDLQFQVEGMDRVYCIGDASNIPETKLGYLAEQHGNLLAENIKKLLAGKSPTPYSPASKEEYGTMLLPLGPDRGAAALGKTVLGDGMTSRLKGKGLFKQKVFQTRNAVAPNL
jgi:apoptosis-inducing factor 2